MSKGLVVEEYAFKAVFGNTVIKGHTFVAVADALIERGFDMAQAARMECGGLSIPHSLPRRRAAKLTFVKNEPEPTPVAVEDERLNALLDAAYSAVYSGRVTPGIQTRPCGAVHSDGVLCLIPVLFEALHCGCGDMVYPHEQAHEAIDDEGVRYRWEEVLVIQDLPFDSYSADQQVSA